MAMTPEELAEQRLRMKFRQAIGEEREACAKLVEEAGHKELGSDSGAAAAARIRGATRARNDDFA